MHPDRPGISFSPTSSPPGDDMPPRRSMLILPWWRRLWAWVTDFHTIVSKVVAVAVASVGLHLWIKGLVTRAEVHAEVKQAVIEAILDLNTDLLITKERGAGIPAWRLQVDERLPKVEDQAAHAEKLGQKANDRVDSYLEKKGGH